MPNLRQVVPILAANTATPVSVVAAIWEGWGGLVSSQGRMTLGMVHIPDSDGPQSRIA